MSKAKGKEDTKTTTKGGEEEMSEKTFASIDGLDHADMLSVPLTDAQSRFYHDTELDGVVFKELVDAEFVERAKKVSDNLDSETLCLMGAWDKNLFRTVLRKWRAEYDSNELRLEDIDTAELKKLAKKVDFAKHEGFVNDIPKQLKKLTKQYKKSREILAGAYNVILGREDKPLKAVAFPRATSLHALRADVIDFLS
jgi:hypothetical protein